MPILFDYHINYLSDSKNKSRLPFSIFGLSQQGISHMGSSIGNQDAGNVYVGSNLLIGCVADGCTSGNNINNKSSNQVGASLTSYLVCRIIRKLLVKKNIAVPDLKDHLEKELLTHFRRIGNILNPWRLERDLVINNFMTATFLMFVVTADDYLIFSCGDGNVYINGNSLDLVSEGGKYFSNNLLQNEQPFDRSQQHVLTVPIKITAQGKANELESILIATDGFIDREVIETPRFNSFFFGTHSSKLQNGFNDLKYEFRTGIADPVLAEKDGRTWPQDDATFISLKRT